MALLSIKAFSQASETIYVEPFDDEIIINIVAPELKPLIYNNVDKKAEGLLIDTLNEVSAQTSLKFNVTIMPWGRAMLEVKSGNADAIMPALYTEERAKYLVYPQQQLINFYGSVFIKNSHDKFEFTSFEEMKNKKTVAKVRAVLLGVQFDEAKNKGLIEIAEVTRLDDALNMLLLKRVDLVGTDGFAAYTSIQEMGIEDKIAVMSISTLEEPSFIAFSQSFSNKHDVNKIMLMINQFNNPNRYKEILPSQ
ncbi:transporter substrate-binding domain-containing protein [Colwellia sp. 1_MG-2023]|uniref:substrate-binding periplasmic protein n=1 Tax=Colwellia sp. 1_MG-2023 TaxID=3062649 RepID=UPI0026E12C17|nr:transporter substrate-binding domain-containing protein [Colwellia sp. 1_MG-2023]MDO6446799.1 transporter substrate-binding domain-containing protein [Colwellia sp. 1_MG-2023]